jgi:hypothetical protein
MPTPTDEKLYESIKKDLFKKYKPSAYRSGLLVQKYKEEYVKKHKNKNYYSGTKENSNLKRWFDEKWRSDSGYIGYKKKDDVYRPTIRINDKTPTTFNELTKNQINKAKKEKAKTGRVKRFLV